MYGANKYRVWLQHPGYNGGGKGSKAPDYTPLAQASKESAKIMAALGREQLDFAKKQYADSAPLFQRLVDDQMSISQTNAARAADYDAYAQTFRPTEQAMLAEANRDRSAEIAAIKQADDADRAIAAGSDADVLAARGLQIGQGVDRAIADSQGAYTRALNQIARQGMRYGGAPSAIGAQAGGMGMAQAQQIAAMANAARAQGIDQARGLAAQNYNMRHDSTTFGNAQDAIGWAKKLDVTGMARGLPGASSGAYGLALQAGNSAGANQMAPGNNLMAGMAQGANTIGSGRQMLQSGLSGVLNAQTSVHNANQNNGLDVGGLMQGAASMYSAGMFSDRRLKRDIERIGTDERTGLPIYEFSYDFEPRKRYQGVMADEVLERYPEAVSHDDRGFMMVDYDMLGISMMEVEHAA